MTQNPIRIVMEHNDQKGIARKRILNPNSDADRETILRTIYWAAHNERVVTITPMTATVEAEATN